MPGRLKCLVGCACKKHFPTEEHKQKVSESKLGVKRTMEQRRRISESHIGQKAWNIGIPMSEDAKIKLRQSRAKQVIPKCKSGCMCPRHSIYLRNPHLIEVRRKQMLGKKFTDEHLANMRSPEVLQKRAMTFLSRYGRPCGPFKDTAPERAIRSWLEEHKVNFHAQHPKYGTVVDFYLPDTNIFLFVDGCWWHGHSCLRQNKVLNQNQIRVQKRDKVTETRIIEAGHKVIRIWECEIKCGDFHKLKKEI
jgi:DNA mismatch endonuclease (patch repair protein)